MSTAEPQKIEYHISGLCCAEEVNLLRRTLGPLIGEENLSFDLLNARLTIAVPNGPPEESRLVGAINSTGMKATPWQEHRRKAQSGETGKQSRGREIACALSGMFWVASIAVLLLAPEARAALIGTSLVAIIAGWWYIAPRAWGSLKRLSPDMNLLMSIALVGAVCIGEWVEAGSVSFLFSLSLLLESWSVSRARRAISALVDLSPKMARVVSCCGTCSSMTAVEEVKTGARVLVKPGERIPLDGTLASGATSVNQAPITGESLPIAKGEGDEIFAGSINNEGAFEFTVTRAAQDTTLARIIRMVEEAQARRARAEQWVERFARVYTPAMIVLAVLIATVPPLVFAQPWGIWFYEALVILVIACPCALVISTPMSIVAGLASSARMGVLVKGGAWLEAAAHIRAVAFDKTGTLTRGEFAVQEIRTFGEASEDDALALAAAIERLSEHPLAAAVVSAAETRKLQISKAENFTAIPGRGAEATVAGRWLWIGSHRLMEERLGEVPAPAGEAAAKLEDAGHTLLALGGDAGLIALISVADQVREEAAASLKKLHKAGLSTVMLTGDNRRTAEEISRQTGITEFRAGLLPEQKVAAVEELVGKHERVAMVGDGINDAPAMAASSLAVAMGAAGTDAAIETADIALMTDDLSRLPWMIAHARRTLGIIRQNVAIALGLKVVFLALALLGIATLWMAIVADIGATLIVIANSLRLLRVSEH